MWSRSPGARSGPRTLPPRKATQPKPPVDRSLAKQKREPWQRSRLRNTNSRFWRGLRMLAHRTTFSAVAILFALLSNLVLGHETDDVPRLSAAEQTIERRDAELKGIEVGMPKVYDDSLLQQMLTATET